MYNKVNIYTCVHVNVFLTADSRWQSKRMWCRFTNHCWTWNPWKGNSAKLNSLFTPRAWLRGKVISLYVCCRCHYRQHENHQIWRYACRHGYVQLVNTKNLSNSAKKWLQCVLNHWLWPTSLTNSVFMLAVPTNHTHCSPCAFCSCAQLPSITV